MMEGVQQVLGGSGKLLQGPHGRRRRWSVRSPESDV